MDAGRAITEATADNRRRSEVFRKGVVTAVDDTVTPNLITVSDGSQTKTMPFTQYLAEVGNVVVWVDQADPFIMGKFAGT